MDEFTIQSLCSRWTVRCLRGLWLVVCLWLLSACAFFSPIAPEASNAPVWQVGQMLEVKSGRVLPLTDWLATLAQYDIVYLGEEHYNRHHVNAAITVLAAARNQGVQPVLTMEMFGWDGQVALNEGLADTRRLDTEGWLEQVRWKANWGGAFDPYRKLVDYAGMHRLALYAMNPPKPLIRQVVTLGLRQVRQRPEWAAWGMEQEEIVDDPRYRTTILDQLRRCHGGGAEEDYLAMYEASMVRDEGMARTVAQAARTQLEGARSWILSYTGGGHIQYNLPVPSRVARRLGVSVKQVTVYLASYDASRAEDIRHLMADGIADYIWLTGISEQGAPQRCR